MKELPCWTIMNCDNAACVARRHPDKKCWELAMELADYRADYSICPDCLVYVLKNGSLSFSPQDLDQIALGRRCPLAT